jgi:hypothetical protein
MGRSTPPPPDFAIVGAARCGTTALYSYLATHPGIAMSRRKEPMFWNSDNASEWNGDAAEYAALWDHAPPGALRGEASADYLKSAVAISRLLAARPDVRLIAMVRNPARIAISTHANMRAYGLEDVADFETAWRLHERRLRGEALPRRLRAVELLHYRAFAQVGDQLERFFALVPANQRIVIVYDDFRSDPRREYRRTLELLGLADDGRAEFARVNATWAMRWAGLPFLPARLERRFGALYRAGRAAGHRIGLHPFAWLAKANRHAWRRKPLRPAFERELIAELLPQVEKVERLLGRDLAAWKTPAPR